jgi:hypothetical protein
MSWASKITTSLFGSRLGLQTLTTNVTGTGQAGRTYDVLVGAEAVRSDASTADSTATYLKPYGVSLLTTGLSADTTAIFRLDPPIPGVEKTIVWGSTTVGTMGSKITVTNSTGGGAGLQTSAGSSFTCASSSAGAVLRLVGVTTALWAVVNGSTASGFTFTTST